MWLPPVISFSAWQGIIHYDSVGNPKWFTYYVLSHIEGTLSIQMAKDLSAHFARKIEVYDLYGFDGEGTAHIRIVS